MANWEERFDSCKDTAILWIQKRRSRDICRWLTCIAVGYITLDYIHHTYLEQRPPREGERTMCCTPSENTYHNYALADKRIYVFDAFLEQDRKAKSWSETLDECAWRSVFDAIRYTQDLYDDREEQKRISDLQKEGRHNLTIRDAYLNKQKKFKPKIGKPWNDGVKVGHPVADVLKKTLRF